MTPTEEVHALKIIPGSLSLLSIYHERKILLHQVLLVPRSASHRSRVNEAKD
jgi:hypothetical protein